jgi:hypothetical protein
MKTLGLLDICASTPPQKDVNLTASADGDAVIEGAFALHQEDEPRNWKGDLV